MPTKRKTYPWTRLPRETLRELVALAEDDYNTQRAAYEAAHPGAPAGRFERDVGSGTPLVLDWSRLDYLNLSVTDEEGQTSFERDEAEDFFDRLGDPCTAYAMSYGWAGGSMPITCVSVSVECRTYELSVSVGHSDSRVVDRIMAVIRDAVAANTVPVPEPEPERPRVFIGHGGSSEWQKTERWLRALGFDVQAYETLPHSGRTIERVLTNALEWANFALLVMTAEDERADQTMQARQNVVHELGLFQGRLGWDQALVMLEDGAAEFSNIAGTNQLRFPAGMIDAKHGDVIVALRERFPGIV